MTLRDRYALFGRKTSRSRTLIKHSWVLTPDRGRIRRVNETSLTTASVLAARGHLELSTVHVIATAAAIIGDDIGYLAGRHGGRGSPAIHQRSLEPLGAGPCTAWRDTLID